MAGYEVKNCLGFFLLLVAPFYGEAQVGTVERGDERPAYAIDGLRNAEWVAMDYADVLVHVFLPETRAFYNLEHLWADAKLTQIPDLD